jgi:hypothetical protein
MYLERNESKERTCHFFSRWLISNISVAFVFMSSGSNNDQECLVNSTYHDRRWRSFHWPSTLHVESSATTSITSSIIESSCIYQWSTDNCSIFSSSSRFMSMASCYSNVSRTALSLVSMDIFIVENEYTCVFVDNDMFVVFKSIHWSLSIVTIAWSYVFVDVRSFKIEHKSLSNQSVDITRFSLAISR